MRSVIQKVLVGALILFFAVICVLSVAVPPAEAAASVTSSQYGYYDSLLEGYYVFGEVRNDGDTPVTDIVVNVNCYDASNNLLNSNPVKGYIDGPNAANIVSSFVLNPGAKAPFNLHIQKSAFSFSYQNIDHLSSTVAFTECDSLPVGLQANVAGVVQVLIPNVQGTVKNTGASRAENVFVYMIGYDADGRIVGPYGQKISASDGGSSLNPGESGSFSLAALLFPVSGETGIKAAKYTITAQSFVQSRADANAFEAQYAVASEITGFITYSSTPAPTSAASPTSSPVHTVSPTVTSSPTPVPTDAHHPGASNDVWIPEPANAVAATAASIAAVSVVSVITSAVNSPAGESAGGLIEKFKDFMPESMRNWLQDKRKTKVEEKKRSPFRPTKVEIVGYVICVLALGLAYAFVKAEELTQLLEILPIMLVVGFIGGFVKTYLGVTFTRSRGVWNEHSVWYFGLATFIITTIAFKMPFAWPSRVVHSESELLKRKEGILSTVDILISIAFSAAFFVLLLQGFELVGSMGLAMCLSIAFFDSLPIRPMSGRHVFKFNKGLWLIMFLICLTLLVAWIMML